MNKENKVTLAITSLYLTMMASPFILSETLSRNELVNTSRGRARVYNWKTARGIEVVQNQGVSGMTVISDYNRDGVPDERNDHVVFPRRAYLVTMRDLTASDRALFSEALAHASTYTLEHKTVN